VESFVPTASIAIVCVPYGKVDEVKAAVFACAAFKYVSTVAATVPSTYTRAMPDHASRYAIQLTWEPVNVNVARAPAVIASLALPPLL
jgi:hypothetical protein